MPHSTLLQLYRGDQFYWRRKPEYPGKTAVSHWQTLSHNVVSCLCGIRTHNISGDRHWLHRYHMITTTTAPRRFKMVWWCLTPPSTIYIRDQFYWGRKPEDPEKTTDLSQVTVKLCHIILYTSSWSIFELLITVVEDLRRWWWITIHNI
jgi:hypothetical protein